MQCFHRHPVRIFALVLVVLAAGCIGVVGALVSRTQPENPQVTAYAHGRSITVAPYVYCTVRLQNCQFGQTASLAATGGHPLQLSLPDPIAQAPWVLQQIYRDGTGAEFTHVTDHTEFPTGIRALTVPSRPAPDLQLVGVELQLPVLARDEQGNDIPVPHAAWSIRTA